MRLRELREAFGRAQQRGVPYPAELAFLLDLPLRKLILPPRQIAHRLHLRPDSRILELGPGPGFFSADVARRAWRGSLVLFDLQRQMLTKARRKLERARATNAAFTQGSAVALPFREESFDVVFLVAVLGEVPSPEACVGEIRRVLVPGGLLSVTEIPGDADFVPLPELQALAERTGLELAEHFGGRWAFTANFRKRRR